MSMWFPFLSKYVVVLYSTSHDDVRWESAYMMRGIKVSGTGIVTRMALGYDWPSDDSSGGSSAPWIPGDHRKLKPGKAKLDKGGLLHVLLTTGINLTTSIKPVNQ